MYPNLNQLSNELIGKNLGYGNLISPLKIKFNWLKDSIILLRSGSENRKTTPQLTILWKY